MEVVNKRQLQEHDETEALSDATSVEATNQEQVHKEESEEVTDKAMAASKNNSFISIIIN
jgi:hypothetical protein